MRTFLETLKGLVFGHPVATGSAGQVTLRTRLALPVFGAGLLSAVAYAPDAILDALRRGGQQGATLWVGVGVVAIMLLLGFAYRSNVRARPDERADYGLVRDELGAQYGLVSGAALLVDYFFTVAVSVSAITGIITFVVPQARGWERVVGVGVIGIMTLVSLRGIRDRTRVLLAVWFGFLIVVAVLAVLGVLHADAATSPSGSAQAGSLSVMAAFAGAIASGAVMVTGIEHLASAGPFHAPPRGRRAGRTLLVATGAAAAAFIVIVWLAWRYRISGWASGPVMLQATDAVLGAPLALWGVAIAGVALLYAAAFAVFRRFTSLASLLARDAYLPRQLSMANDRYVFRGGVLIVAGLSSLLIVLSGAELLVLIHMYVIGAFASIVLSQIAMVRHLGAAVTREGSRRKRRALAGRRVLHVVAAAVAFLVWIVVSVFNFASGAWIALVLIVSLVILMRAISKHYAHMRADVALTPDDRSDALPSATHGIVLVAQLHRPAMRAMAFAKAARHTRLEAVTVAIEPRDAERLQREWGRRELGMPLIVLESRYRDLGGPVIEYVRSLHRASPRDMVVVYVPEYVVGRWWERLLHNKSSERLREQLLDVPNVVVSAVPWHLESARERALALETDGQTRA